MNRLTQSSVRNPRPYDALFLALLMIYILIGTPLVPFHGDESTLTYMSRDYAYQFIQRDLDLVRYRDDSPSPQEQYLRLINGSISKYLIGFAWHTAGYTIADINEQWDWGADWDYNFANNHAPSEAMLKAIRWPNAIMLALSVVVLFGIGWQLGGRRVAYLASLYYALNPGVLINGRRAVMEAPMLLFGLLTVLAGLWFLRHPSWRSALGLGISCGLALSGKHTNLFLVGAVVAAAVLYPLVYQLVVHRRPPVNLRVMALLLALAGAAGALVFWVLNSVWWGSNPLQQMLLVLRLRSDLLAGQTATFGGYDGRLDQLAGFARQAFMGLPQHFEVQGWGEWLAPQITQYEASPWRGISLGGSVPGAIILFALVLFGLWSLIRDHLTPLSSRWLIGLWAVAMLLTTWLLTPIEWQRYYLPAYPAVGLLAALGVRWLTAIITQKRTE